MKASGGQAFYHYQEFRLPNKGKLDGLTVGAQLTAEAFKEGELVDVTAISKGKGFQGVMKSWHFGGMPASHGHSISHRMPGSIGNRADPGRVFKNKKMATHLGQERVTIQNVRLIKIDLENGLMLVHGSIPGPKTSIVTIQKAVKSIGSKR